MRKTEAHDLNLIDMDDTFSPDPINENTQKLEAALADTEDRLDQRLKALEAHRMYAGSYTGTHTGNTTTGSLDQTISLSFTPAVVFIHAKKATATIVTGLALPNSPVTNNSRDILRIVSNGFYVSDDLNKSATTYHFLALA